jgi:hypothetical protein
MYEVKNCISYLSARLEMFNQHYNYLKVKTFGNRYNTQIWTNCLLLVSYYYC